MRSFTLALSLTASLLLLAGCNDSSSSASKTLVSAKQTPIAVISPEFGTFNSRVSATASIEPSPDGIVSITSPVVGTVDAIRVGIGERVNASSGLITIRSSDVSDTQNDRLSAKAAYQQAKRAYEMNKELLSLGAITAAEFAASESALHQSEAMLHGFEQKLNYYGASSPQSLVLRSPIAGVVYEITTHLGEKVGSDPDQVLVKVANPSRKTIVAMVYEKDLGAFVPGEKVSIVLKNHEDANLSGTVHYVSDVLDPQNRTTKVYIKPDADSPLLKRNMFATIHVDAHNANVFRIPKKSLLFREGKFVVFVEKDGSFVPREVSLISDDPSDDFSLIRGIETGSKIALEAITLERQ